MMRRNRLVMCKEYCCFLALAKRIDEPIPLCAQRIRCGLRLKASARIGGVQTEDAPMVIFEREERLLLLECRQHCVEEVFAPTVHFVIPVECKASIRLNRGIWIRHVHSHWPHVQEPFAFVSRSAVVNITKVN